MMESAVVRGGKTVNIHEATRQYERWMAGHLRIVRRDLIYKHEAMTLSRFSFFRATFYRWLQLWARNLPGEAQALRLLAVGDLHVENFGTWRDWEGRLIWGINDFDEAYPMPYTMDLVRLVTSAHLATAENHLAIRPRDASDAVLDGYREALQSGGNPFVLGEKHRWLRLIATSELRNPILFWEKMLGFARFRGKAPAAVRRQLIRMIPPGHLPIDEKQRLAGLGSLGHARLVLIARWRGGYMAREAKALTPSACVWISGRKVSSIRYEEILRCAMRVPDPHVMPMGSWLLRRLAPDCSRVELSTLPKKRDEERFLRAMGWETANIHLGSRRAIPAIQKDLAKRGPNWLHKAARKMAEAIDRDWNKWRRQ
jgi:hypothetical protein